MPLPDRTEGPKPKLPWRNAWFALFAAIVGLTAQQALSQQAAPAAPAPAAPALSKEDADAVILDRQLIMQALDEDAMALGEIAAGLKPVTELPTHAASLAKHAKEAVKSFEAKVPGGGSKPEVWTNWADFSKKMDGFVAGSEKLTQTSPSGDLMAIGTVMLEAMPCKACHDVYRIKKP